MDTPRLPVRNGNAVYIPIEIIDEILDHLRTDESCLRSCALVSKSWTPSCRKHIFYRVTLGDPLGFVKWTNSIPAAPNGPHLYTRELTIINRYLEKEYHRSPENLTLFLKHFTLFCNVQDLVIECSANRQTIDNISVPDVFGHLFDTLRSLSIRGAFCSPQALISLVASFQHLERLNLDGFWFSSSETPRPLPERHIFRGAFHLTDWDDSSEEFVSLLTEHDLQYREVCVNGECWLRDTAWNRCLAKCVDNLEKFSIHWSENDCFPPDRFKALTFKNLRSLFVQSSSECTTILPPPEFLHSIKSTQLSEIMIDVTVFPPGEELDEALNWIRDYDEALCQLANQLDPSSSGSEKLVLTLGLVEELPDPTAVLPRFSKMGVLKIEAMGM
ncbi:hypothetical protein BDM02DRAFT_3192080 [Thelephora ganbajun]|uniref:Uncharacterized protein n=1 Tax=Thelephora ganbajun TaxID=370292 RepID=A0ACB6Z174_THEGA|nr:hypothetical protein BDM02DRAFT_3192080 [Thelephora ganbajun]